MLKSIDEELSGQNALQKSIQIKHKTGLTFKAALKEFCKFEFWIFG